MHRSGRGRSPRRLVAAVVLATLLMVIPAAGAAVSFSGPTTYATTVVEAVVEVADMNEDGFLDIVALSGGYEIQILLGNGTGGFPTSTTSAPGPGNIGRGTAIADFDEDGNLDVAAAKQGNQPGFNFVEIFLGDGAGNLALGQTIAEAAGPFEIAAGDFNGDDNVDLGVACINGALKVLLGDGDGNFAESDADATSSTPTGVAAGDINGDGKLDLVVASQGSTAGDTDVVDVFLGDGTGEMALLASPAAQDAAGDVAVGDLNDDSNLDLAVSNQNSRSVSIMLGDGTGSNWVISHYPTGGGTRIAMGDVDGDGDNDVGTTLQADGPSPSGMIYVLENSGTGAFTVHDFTSGHSPNSIAFGDFNGDGMPDIVHGNRFEQSLSVLLNASTPPPVTYVVDRTNDPNPPASACTAAPDDCSLRGAVIAANSHAATGPDVIQVPAGTYGLETLGQNENAAATGDLDITDEVTIVGEGTDVTLVDGLEADRVFDVFTAGSVTLESMTIAFGTTHSCGGGIRNEGTSLRLTDMTVRNNAAFGDGGGLCSTSSGPVSGSITINDSEFVNNDANSSGSTELGGGGINATGTVTITDTLFGGNTARKNAAIGHVDGSLTLNRVSVVNNTGFDSNSGVGKCGGTLTVTNSTFSDNVPSSASFGNAIDTNDAVATLNNVTIADNGSPAVMAHAGGCGGGTSSITIRNSILANNGAEECAGTIVAIYSLIENVGACTLGGGSGNNVTGADPNLAALATIAPGTTPIRPLQLPSPAYNAASPAAYNSGGDSCVGIDQQTEQRAGGGRCDMGADELLVPDLKQTKTDSPDPVVLGSGTNVVYTLTTKNLGGATAHNVAVTDPLPASMTFVSAPGCVYTVGTHTVDCALGDLAAGAVVTSSITVTPTASGTVSNSATASMTETDPTPASNTATQATKVVGLKTLTFVPTIGVGGCSLQGKVTLTSAAPTGGVTVGLSDTHPSADVPPSVVVPGGTGSKTFTITNPHVTSNQVGNVTATLFGNSLVKSLTVRPIGVKTLTLAPNPVTEGNAVTGTVTLDCAAPVDVTVFTTSNKPGVAQPTAPSFVITAGNSSGTFDVDTFGVPASTTAKITATANGIAKSQLLTVNDD